MNRRWLILSLMLVLAGCGFLRPQRKSYFILETVLADAPPARLQGLPVGIDSLELPPPIDRREIAVRERSGRLNLRGTELWSAPLESMVIHILAFNLASRIPEGMIVLPGQAKPIGAMRSIHVIAEKFEAGPEAVLVLDARWIVTEPGGAPVTRHERITVPMESLESAQIALGMSRALATLADRIVAALTPA